MTTKMNATPRVVTQGIQDLSAVAQAVALDSLPTHLPKVFLFAKKGPTDEPQLVGDGATTMFGDETFDPQSKYATHQTAAAKIALKYANAQMIERMIPTDAPLKANFALWIDIKADPTVATYARNADGTWIRDPITGDRTEIDGSDVPGYKIKWVLETISVGDATDPDSALFGTLVSKPGAIGGGSGSTMYPILQFWASSFGAYGNNAGFRIWAPKATDLDPVAANLMAKVKAYPFRISSIRRADADSTAKLVPMLSGDMSFDFVIPAGTINPYTASDVSLAKQFEKAWQQKNQPGYDNFYADLGGLKVYQANIKTVVDMIYAREVANLPPVTDFDPLKTDQAWMVNFISGMSSSGAEYNTLNWNTTDANAISLTENTNLFAKSGGDGTMGNAALDALVATRMDDYADPTSTLQDTARAVETVLYDTGFSLTTKQKLAKFISLRKNTFVHLSTRDVAADAQGETEEAAIASSLRATLELYPESIPFGTSVVRGMITARYGDYLTYDFGYKLPLTLHVMEKSCRMMGASNGSWKKQYLFDRGELNVVDSFANINVNFVPEDQRNKDWANGMNYPLSYNRNSVFFPAMKTAYSDDTSVLTSYFTALACVEAENVGLRVWRMFSGSTSLTEGQFTDRVNKEVEKQLSGRFAGMFVMKSECTITSSDADRGYSWTLAIKIYANNMKTVQTLSVQAYRMAALTA